MTTGMQGIVEWLSQRREAIADSGLEVDLPTGDWQFVDIFGSGACGRVTLNADDTVDYEIIDANDSATLLFRTERTVTDDGLSAWLVALSQANAERRRLGR